MWMRVLRSLVVGLVMVVEESEEEEEEVLGVVVVVGVRGDGVLDGSWTPTLMARECCFAVSQSPRTKGDVWRGWTRERDSRAFNAM